MEAYLLDWINLLLRWAHVVVVIAWIGSSFYFVFLDNSLTPPEDPALKAKGVDGELCAVHGGGFYNPQKYMGSPGRIPQHRHGFTGGIIPTCRTDLAPSPYFVLTPSHTCRT